MTINLDGPELITAEYNMDPPTIANELDQYIQSLELQEIQDIFELINEERDQHLYIQETEDEVDLVDG